VKIGERGKGKGERGKGKREKGKGKKQRLMVLRIAIYRFHGQHEYFHDYWNLDLDLPY
jgi:hypothetical protein